MKKQKQNAYLPFILLAAVIVVTVRAGSADED